MEHLLKKNNELEQRLTENQIEIQQFIKQQLAENALLLKKNDELEARVIENKKEMQGYIQQQLAENKKQTEKDSQEATKSLNSINTKIEDRAKIGSTSYFLGWIQS
jgi:ribosomal protein S1